MPTIETGQYPPMLPEEPYDVVASWDAANVFGTDRWREALHLVLQQRASAVYVAEMLGRGSSADEQKLARRRMNEIGRALDGEGYALHIQDMSPDRTARNEHWQAVIARKRPDIAVSTAVFGERNGFIVDLGRVSTRAYLMHASDASSPARVAGAKAVRSGANGYQKHLAQPGRSSDGVVVGGDLSLLADDSLNQLTGLHDADRWHDATMEQPIVKGGVLKVLRLLGAQRLIMQRQHIDHFMVNGNANVVPASYRVVAPRQQGGEGLSDHGLIRMALHDARSRQPK